MNCEQVDNMALSGIILFCGCCFIHKLRVFCTSYPQSYTQPNRLLSTLSKPENTSRIKVGFPIIHISTITTAYLNYHFV
jgi:hypothetical protein